MIEIGTTIHDEPVIVRKSRGLYRVEIDTVKMGAHANEADAIAQALTYVPNHRRAA